MSEQAGYYRITFYELYGLELTYDASGYITNIATSGDTIIVSDVEHNYPGVDFDIIEAENNNIAMNATIKFQYNNITAANITNLDKLSNSIYGFVAKLERNIGTSWFINSSFKGTIEEVNTSEQHIFFVDMNAKTLKTFEKLA